jgi:hypothetical protein
VTYNDERAKQRDRKRGALDRKAEESRARSEQESLAASGRRSDDLSVRAKSSGHKKKTADKWNQ